MFGLAHIDALPFIYGVALFAGFISLWLKITQGLLYIAIIEVTFFIITFKMHGGSMTGSLAAVIAAMLVGYFLKRRHYRQNA